MNMVHRQPDFGCEGTVSGDQAGELSQVQVMKGPLSHVWTYPEDKRTHQRVLRRGRTGLIRDFPGSDGENGVETE